MNDLISAITTSDPQIADLIDQENKRQQDTIRLIPSENYVSPAVLAATGSALTNKYSEGYPGRRYYQGQEIIDQIETLAQERAKKLFNVDHVNVQPYSGSPANFATLAALLEPGDTILGLQLSHGGHLTHGAQVSFSGRFFNAVGYTVDPETHLLNLDLIRELALKHKPKLIIAGLTAYPREIDFAGFAAIAKEVGAYLLADIAHISGLIAAGEHPTPSGHADVINTTTHKTLRGPRGAMIMSTAELADQLDKAVFPGLQGGPHNNTTAAIAVALAEAATLDFTSYAKQTRLNAKALADALTDNGFTLVTGGTDNHLMIINSIAENIPGKKLAIALSRAGIITNFNTIPFDERSPFSPSGVRIGTPAITTRGMKEPEMKQIATWMREVANNIGNKPKMATIADQVKEFCQAFPAPGIPVS